MFNCSKLQLTILISVLFTCFVFFCFALFLYRKQLSEYLPASVLKQKKRSSAAPSDGKKEVNFFYFILLLYLSVKREGHVFCPRYRVLSSLLPA